MTFVVFFLSTHTHTHTMLKYEELVANFYKGCFFAAASLV